MQINYELNGAHYYEQHFPDGGIKLYDNNWYLKWETLLKMDFSLDGITGVRFGVRSDGIYIIFFISATSYYQLNAVASGLILEKYDDGQLQIIWVK